MARQSTGKAEQPHSGRGPTHARTDGWTDGQSDVFRHCSCLPALHLYAGVSRQDVPRQLSKPSQQKERQNPNTNQSKHLVALHISAVHPLRPSSKVASVCITYSSFASGLICTVAVQENKVLRLFCFSSCQTRSKPSKPQHQKILLARDGTDELFHASAQTV